MKREKGKVVLQKKQTFLHKRNSKYSFLLYNIYWQWKEKKKRLISFWCSKGMILNKKKKKTQNCWKNKREDFTVGHEIKKKKKKKTRIFLKIDLLLERSISQLGKRLFSSDRMHFLKRKKQGVCDTVPDQNDPKTALLSSYGIVYFFFSLFVIFCAETTWNNTKKNTHSRGKW